MDKPTLIPVYIEAKTKDELVGRMLKVNIENGAFHKFFDIQKDGSKWVAWYYKDMESTITSRIK